MSHIRVMSKVPSVAQDVAPEVKLTLFRDILGVTGENGEAVSILDLIIPLFINKDAENPVP